MKNRIFDRKIDFSTPPHNSQRFHTNIVKIECERNNDWVAEDLIELIDELTQCFVNLEVTPPEVSGFILKTIMKGENYIEKIQIILTETFNKSFSLKISNFLDNNLLKTIMKKSLNDRANIMLTKRTIMMTPLTMWYPKRKKNSGNALRNISSSFVACSSWHTAASSK